MWIMQNELFQFVNQLMQIIEKYWSLAHRIEIHSHGLQVFDDCVWKLRGQ